MSKQDQIAADIIVESHLKEFLTPKMLVNDPTCPFSEKALRFHIWRSGINGLAPAIYRVGKKILIKRSEWLKWLESHAQKKKSTQRGISE